ncbi:hypothetical protein E4U55_005608 [Claviceps digitariae]|nr:hypothetical protein E4U55_005608 [Claviceps digitariae]
MGLLNFLNKRSAEDGKSDQYFSLHNGRPMLKGSVTNPRSSNVPSISSSSAASLSRAQGHVDILDAHGGIRPYDFRSRVQATGVRDYGEDVAERNMGENGVDVRSAAAREFYQRKASRSIQSLSMARRGREADHPSSFGGSTYNGSEADDVSFIENWTLKRPLSTTLSLESRQDVSVSVSGGGGGGGGWGMVPGVAAGRPVVSPVSPALQQHRRSMQMLPTDRNSGSARSGKSRDINKTRISAAERSVAGAGLNNTSRQSRQSPSHSGSRSISPPCVPRYRSQSSLSARREEERSRIVGSRRAGENRGTGTASAAAMSSSRGVAAPRSNLSREDAGADPRLERLYTVGSEAGFDFGVPATLHAGRAPKPRPVSLASPLLHHPDWHNVVRRAVDETLAQLPLTVDWKALLEMTQNGLVLDDDVARKGPLRHSALWQGHLTHSSSTPTTADFSDYSSSIAGYPGSRHTTATSTDSLVRTDTPCPKAGSGSGESGHFGAVDDRVSAGDHHDYQNSPAIAAVDEDHGLPEPSTRPCSEEVPYYPDGMNNIEHAGSPASESSEVDSFIGKHQRGTVEKQEVKNENEGLFFHDRSLSDLGANLPGLVADTSSNECEVDENPNECVICNVLGKVHGNSAPSTPCNHNGTMTRKQRLQALGYDYESDESDVGAGTTAATAAAATPPSAKSSSRATKRLTLTSGSGGGLRRLKLVDDHIEEASEEERTGSHDARRRQGLGRKLNLGGLARAQSPCVAGNVADME